MLGARRNLFAAARVREVLAARLGIEPPGAEVFHNPLAFPVPPEAPRWPDPGGPLRLVGMGTLAFDTKAQDVLIEALAAERWRGRAWRLDLFGEGPDRSRIEALVRARGLADRVALRGHTANVAGALSEAHLLVQASRVEAMPIAVHEAMAMARPSLVTRIGDMPRWIQDGETGFVAERPEPELVGRALEAAWAARDRLQALGRAARDEFLARFPADPVGAFSETVVAAAIPRT